MSFVCLSSPRWPTDAASAADLATTLLACVPRVTTDARGLLWADARGLKVHDVVDAIADIVRKRRETDVHIGAAATAVAASVATRSKNVLTIVEPGDDAAFLAPFSIDVLDPSPELLRLLDGTGIVTCRDLAVLDHEAVEVRFGVEGVHLWRLARADDQRPIFTEVPRTFPHASLDWVDYTLTDPERLIFIINALATRVSESLAELGESARELVLVFSLANQKQSTHRVRFTRPTASRKTWMHQIRTLLERVTLGDAVVGVLLRVESVAAKHSPQGDLFDRGFASAGATEEALAQLVDDQGEILLAPERSRHVLLDRRTRWVAESPVTLVERSGSEVGAGREPSLPRLTLQLLPDPRPIAVVTSERRDHQVPVRYQDESRWHDLADVAGPDRVSGGHWEESYAREYFRGIREDGVMVWLYRDGRDDRWYFHGWWD
jgi:nucleotidyltransferase/DNA polymerase involved in DNA repair